MHRIFALPFTSLYPLYVAKVERKGRTVAELDAVLSWLTGFNGKEIKQHIDSGTTLQELFSSAKLNPKASLITGVICGIRVEEIENPLMQKIRYMDKVVDELAKGKALEIILRT